MICPLLICTCLQRQTSHGQTPIQPKGRCGQRQAGKAFSSTSSLRRVKADHLTVTGARKSVAERLAGKKPATNTSSLKTTTNDAARIIAMKEEASATADKGTTSISAYSLASGESEARETLQTVWTGTRKYYTHTEQLYETLHLQLEVR